MHFHCEVWVPTKDKWRSQVVKALRGYSEQEHSDGFYDWYVIGGRWSGEHTRWQLVKKFGEEIMKKIHDEFEKKYGWWTNKDNDEVKRARQYEEVFRKHISKEQWDNPIQLPGWRDTYKQDGFEDDIIALKDVPWEHFSCHTFLISKPKDYVMEASSNEIKSLLSKYKIKDGYLATVDYHC